MVVTLTGAAPAQTPAPPKAEDTLTATALRLSLAGRPYDLMSLYEETTLIERAESILPSRALRSRHWLQDNIADLLAGSVATDRDELLRIHRKAGEFPYRDANSELFDSMVRMKITVPSLSAMRRRIFFGRFASVFNRLGSGISQLLSGETVVLLQLPVDAVYAFWRLRVANPLERRLIWMQSAYARQGGFIENPVKFEKQLTALEQKRRRAFMLQDYERGKAAWRAGDLLIADFYFSRAVERMPDEDGARAWRDRVRREIREQQRRREDATVIPPPDAAADSGVSDPEGQATQLQITQLLAAGQWEDSSELAQRWASEDPRHAPLDDIELIDAVAAYALGFRARARVYFQWLADRFAGESSGRYSRSILTSAYHFPSNAIRQARARFRTDTRRFVFLGYAPGDYAYLTASQAATLQPAWVRDAAFVFVFDWLVRGIYALAANPVSRDGIIDATRQAYMRRGHDEDPAPLLRDLRVNSAREGRLDQAVFYATLEGLPPRQIERLRTKEIKKLYRTILQVKDPELRLHLFQRLNADYPDNALEDKIAARIAELTEQMTVEAHMDLKTFRRNLAIFNETCFYFDPLLTDGRRDNGEISKEGITLRRDKTLTFHEVYLNETKMIPLDDALYKRIREFFALHGRLERLEKARRSRETAEKAYLEIRGGLGASGADLYPGISPAQISDETRALFD
ncbi:MAG: hypothetical protein Kow0059_02120 [Candidatus Sumerlaeia bacterium]